jgi:diguanylate cyclase (GGDEF)-like protein
MAAGKAWLPIELFDAFGAGIYLLFGIIHLDLWARRRDRMGHLWLAGASASALLVDITGMLNRRLDPWTPAWMMALNTLGVAAATVCLFELVSSLNRATAGRLARVLQGLVLVFAVVFGLAFPRAVPMVFAGCMVLLIWAMAKAFLAAREGNQDSGMVARGFMVLVACLVADILKDFHLVTLPSGLPLVGFIVLFLASARSLNDRFGREEEASRTDTLTGLFNRRGFLEASDGAVLRSRRSGRPLSIVLADVDRFKEVNDSLSHAAGDAALKALAGALRSALRAQDTVARWGGDEFIVLLPETAKEGALRVSESLRAVVSALRVDFEGARVHLTLSLGVAEHFADRSVEDTIAEADSALYQAKEEGRNRVVVR